MTEREFLAAIRACRHRLNTAGGLRNLVFALCIGAGAGILFQGAAFVTPLYYVNFYTGLALVLAVLAALAVTCARRVSMERAALVMDGFGFKERIITAYEHLGEEGDLIRLQREDAMRQLQTGKGRIRIALWPSRRRLALLIGMFAVLLGLAAAPSTVKDRARELHEIQEEAREKEKEIEKVVEELEQLGQEELTPEQLAALQEMIESLQSSAEEYQQAASAEALAAAGEKLDYKYENMSSQMAGLAQSLQNGAGVSSVTAQSMQAMADKLQQMSGNTSPDGGELASNQGQNGGNQGSPTGQGGQSGDGQSGSQGGQSGDGQGGGQSGDGQGGGQGSQSGDGQGGGQDGQGSGNQGAGDGAGGGRGTGSSNALHDYVSVPNAIADSGNLTANAVDHNVSEYFRAQNGLSWEGTHMSHEAVIGSYEQNAYEGIAAGRYPSGMENVIKEYFASFN